MNVNTNSNKNNHKKNIEKIYAWLMKSYGPQGWWPVLNHKGKKPNITGNLRGYHPKDYSYPRNSNQGFEICVGAILTQNTAWKNVEKALINLKAAKVLSPRKLIQLGDKELKELIRPAGYYNQKAGYLLTFTEFFLSLKGKVPARGEVLNCKGIGDETADSMLLYAYSQLEFVVDAYTRRIFSNLGFIKHDEKYMIIKELFETYVERDVFIYQEYHALIVEHAKRYYSKKPYRINDPLNKIL